MFSWIKFIGLDYPTNLIRESLKFLIKILPFWFIYSLPNALWLSSGIIAFNEVWKNNFKTKIFWISLFSLFAIGSELAQVINLVPGTFDFQDLWFMLVFGFLSVFYIKLSQKKEIIN